MPIFSLDFILAEKTCFQGVALLFLLVRQRFGVLTVMPTGSSSINTTRISIEELVCCFKASFNPAGIKYFESKRPFKRVLMKTAYSYLR